MLNNFLIAKLRIMLKIINADRITIKDSIIRLISKVDNCLKLQGVKNDATGTKKMARPIKKSFKKVKTQTNC